ncbi:MAG: DoxX family protein [Candidatus Omnitrophica bacterium]|nr:DoxX family protein [Candidatus Omnitrophota bacterium]MDE2213491.1 DoxX family protein [Candidatus Omnitrophota bacterium]MDE2230608.1 DoxX family protein [Candidatus Omnitrophota bacterium]
MEFIVLLGRILYSLIFILSSFNDFTRPVIGFAAKHGVPMAHVLVPLAGILALLGGVCILLGYKTRWGAWMLVVFLVPVTLMMHNFWAVSDPMMRQMQMVNFLKNTSMLGAALLIAYFGSGLCSLDGNKIDK